MVTLDLGSKTIYVLQVNWLQLSSTHLFIFRNEQPFFRNSNISFQIKYELIHMTKMEIKWNHLSKAFNKVFLINRPNKTVGKKKVLLKFM